LGKLDEPSAPEQNLRLQIENLEIQIANDLRVPAPIILQLSMLILQFPISIHG